MAIEHTRITIRPFIESDIEDVLLWLGDNRVLQNTRMETSNSKEEALDFIKTKWIYPLHQSICLDDHSIGVIWVLPYDNEKHKADLGYAIGCNYWGQGIVTKALKILLCKVFQEFPHLHRLQAHTLVENKASQRVLEKVGFHREGLLRKLFCHKGSIEDFYIFSFLSTDEILHAV
ncbi:putative N-acetyltransferase p20 [Trifolium repens]|nr:putative N-acetyltransferase p20 [Trifolium repens]